LSALDARSVREYDGDVAVGNGLSECLLKLRLPRLPENPMSIRKRLVETCGNGASAGVMTRATSGHSVAGNTQTGEFVVGEIN
jgi:hypothetical protein